MSQFDIIGLPMINKIARTSTFFNTECKYLHCNDNYNLKPGEEENTTVKLK